MFYKNTSYTVKTFYGVTFQPGETKEVDGQINNKWMIKADPPSKPVTKETQKKLSSDNPKKEASKPEEPKKDKDDKELEDSKQNDKASDNKEPKS